MHTRAFIHRLNEEYYMRKPTLGAGRSSTRGHVMVETALIFVAFFSMLLGIFDFGQFLFLHQALVERARSATRWGAMNDATEDEIKNKMLYDQSTNPGGTGYFGLTSSMVVVTKTTDAICVVNDPTVYPTLYKRINVRVQNYPYVMLSLFSGGTYNGATIAVASPSFLDFASPQTSTC
jgi:Flp pilus assembly protein TadG